MGSFIIGVVIGLVLGWLFLKQPQLVRDAWAWLKKQVSGE